MSRQLIAVGANVLSVAAWAMRNPGKKAALYRSGGVLIMTYQPESELFDELTNTVSYGIQPELPDLNVATPLPTRVRKPGACSHPTCIAKYPCPIHDRSTSHS